MNIAESGIAKKDSYSYQIENYKLYNLFSLF